QSFARYLLFITRAGNHKQCLLFDQKRSLLRSAFSASHEDLVYFRSGAPRPSVIFPASQEHHDQLQQQTQERYECGCVRVCRVAKSPPPPSSRAFSRQYTQKSLLSRRMFYHQPPPPPSMVL
ncbi:unnamed protein product, partial [Sphacelaria rigidula]